MKKGQEPAFPIEVYENTQMGYQQKYHFRGMSTRLYLAGMAMQGLLSNPSFSENTLAVIAKDAINMADALIKIEEESR